MDSFADHMFTEAVKAEQDKLGVKERFEHMYQNRFTGPLDEDMRAFIETRTSFYMATVSQTGWPYVQYRGGPKGFIKFLDDETIGFADYRGNKQLISKGNLEHVRRRWDHRSRKDARQNRHLERRCVSTKRRNALAGDDRVSLILMDYPRQARLKLIGHMKMLDLSQAPSLAEKLNTLSDAMIERVATIHITSVDWNCPKYIEPRYTLNEVTELMGPQLAQNSQKLAKLKARLIELGEDPDAILKGE